MSWRTTLVLLAASAAVALSGCRGEPTPEAPVVPIRNMYTQPRYEVQARSDFFPDHRTMRPPVPDTVAQESDPSLPVVTGRTEDDSAWLLTVPQKVVQGFGGWKATLERGQDRFNIYCAPCHGNSGDGLGLVARRAAALGAGAILPPTFHQDRIRHMPDGQIFATITHGIRNMPAYGFNIPVHDRWAIVSYVRALQLSQASREATPVSPENKP
ncbi:MAG: cytochrome c [Myxococcales bacterium]|nr:cytochrome c [Myxococcales bacterium]